MAVPAQQNYYLPHERAMPAAPAMRRSSVTELVRAAAAAAEVPLTPRSAAAQVQQEVEPEAFEYNEFNQRVPVARRATSPEQHRAAPPVQQYTDYPIQQRTASPEQHRAAPPVQQCTDYPVQQRAASPEQHRAAPPIQRGARIVHYDEQIELARKLDRLQSDHPVNAILLDIGRELDSLRTSRPMYQHGLNPYRPY